MGNNEDKQEDDTKEGFHLRGLSHHYDGQATALVDITAHIPARETIAVLGPSGRGKSTLLALLGLLGDNEGTQGELLFHDGEREHDLVRMKPEEKAALRSTAFGFVLQSNYFLPHFSCLQNLAMPLAFHGWPARLREKWATDLLCAEGVDPRGDLRDKKASVPRQASLGQRQRYGVLRAVITDPLVVFADEPSSNLDPGSTHAMCDLMSRWKCGALFDQPRKPFTTATHLPAPVRSWLDATAARTNRTLVLVCHDVQLARRLATLFLLLNQEHKLEASFSRSEWEHHAPTVERILGLPPGTAGRDLP